MEYYTTICRLCEASDKIGEKWVDLYSSGNQQLVSKIRECTNIEIHKKDKLPKRICGRCHRSLEQAYKFRQQCELANAKLHHEIEFLESNHWNAKLTIPPFDCSRYLVVKDESATPLPEAPEPVYIKSELDEEELPDVDSSRFLAPPDDADGDFCTTKVEAQLEEDEESDEEDEDNDEDHSSSDGSGDSDGSEGSEEELLVEKKPAGSKNVDEEDGKPRVNICEACGEQFDKASYLYAHIRAVHGKKRFKCPDCNKCFSRRSRLADHQLLHSGVRQFECPQCDRKYATQQGLKTHTENMHCEDAPYVCDKCGKGFPKEGKLRHHYSVHIESRDFMCGICSKGYKTQIHLNLHMNCHLPQDQKRKRKRRDRHKICVCPFCGKVSNSLGTHTMHIRTHTGDQRYECDVCFKRFTSSGSHKKHLRVHSGEKPYVCEFCQKSFRQKHHLTTHVRGVHTNEKPYQCKFCPKAFATRGNMTLHERSHGGPDANAMVSGASSTVKQEHLFLGGGGSGLTSAEVSMSGNLSDSSPMVMSTPSPMMNPGVMIDPVLSEHHSDIYFHGRD